ncbi:hypothetical protein [Pseudonocardia alni]|uniref:hypothetical protein n=1 Tax=Pseudonocardia alni TaxID=33907 RepID=UPI00280ACF3B|nr:hypothetical protein [Pseudonocardia alni]
MAGPRRRRRRLDDSHVTVRKVSDQLGHSKVGMTQDRHLGCRLTDRQTADVLEDLFAEDTKTVPKPYSDLEDEPDASL